MPGKVNITSNGIHKILKNYTALQAIAEYIWNGFDARADTVSIRYEANELGYIEHLSITDNGTGIDLDKLEVKFNPFYDSEKAVTIKAPKHTSLMHGKNGVGRLTFFTFSDTAKWESTFIRDGQIHNGSIIIHIDGLNRYVAEPLEQQVLTKPGTKVSFFNIKLSAEEMEQSVVPFLETEFCWFLELQREKGYRILVNDRPLHYKANIKEIEEEFTILYEPANTLFRIKYVQWEKALHKEFSKYYFINGRGDEVYKDYTTLNKKSDDFFHSVYIQSAFFDEFDFTATEDQVQTHLFGQAKSSEAYRFLMKNLNSFLKAKRKRFLQRYATGLAAQYDQEHLLPVYGSKEEERMKKPQLMSLLSGICALQPKLFHHLNQEQKKTMLRLFDLLLDSNKRAHFYELLAQVVDAEDTTLQQETREWAASLQQQRVMALTALAAN